MDKKEIMGLFENEEEGHTTNYIKVISKEPIKNAPCIIKVMPEKFEEGCLLI